MGNQHSSHEEAKNQDNKEKVISPIKNLNQTETSPIALIKDNSSYKGIKTDTITKDDQSDSKETNINTSNTSPQEMKAPTIFEWKDGGSVAYVTGSFSNWTQWFVMTKNLTSGNFELSIDLPRGIHQYKFIVDNKWMFSRHHPTCHDEKGNINNIIDTSLKSVEIPKEKPQPKIEATTKDDYSDYIPRKEEMNLDAPHVPPHYSNFFNIDCNSHQKSIGNQTFLNCCIQTSKNENSSFKDISLIYHANL
jgi:hypothetical protein